MYNRSIAQCRTLLLIMIMLISTCIFAGQVYADGTNITQGKTATSKPAADGQGINISHMAPYGPSRAVDGDTGALSRWQTRKGVDGSYLQVDLGAVHAIDRWVVYNQRYSWNNDPIYIMKAYKLQKSDDGVTFTDVDTVLGNTLSVTDRPVTKFIARYLRVQVIEGSLDANGNHWDCILEFQAFGNPLTKPYVNTTTAISITGYSATLSGDVTSDGYAAITERGFVYSTADNPEIGGADVYTATAPGTTGTFSQTITTGLVKNTQYYYRAYAKNIMGTTYGAIQSFTTLDLRANISAPQPLIETTLNNMTIVANITGDTFADSTLAASNFVLANAPAGLTVESVQYDSATQCTLNLAYDGADFDSDISNLTLTVKGAELVSNCDLAASDNLTVTALNDDEGIAIANNSQIAEGEESGGEITITLTGGTFAPSLNLGNWTVSNLPAGVTPGSITRDSSTGARIVLAGNSTEDYDADITDITVSCTTAEYSDSTGGAVLTQTSGVTLTARNEPSDIVLSMASVDENQVSGTVVGTLSTIDSDVGDTFTYSLVSGPGDTDNGSFTIQDDELLTNEVFDYETRTSYNIRVKTVDSFGSTYEESLQINIIDVYEIPNVTNISIKTQPRLAYTEGNSLDLGTLAVTLHMDNGTAEDIAFADFAANEITTDTADGKVLALTDDGSKITVTHTASGQSVQTNSLTVNAAAVASISIKTQPDLVYTEGDSLDLGSLAVTLHKDNATTEDIAFADFAANGITTDIADGKVLTPADDGAKISVTHTASGQSVQTNSLTVNSASVTSISIKTQPGLVYTEGDSLDLGSLAVTLHKNNATTEDIAFADFAANGITTDIADGKVLTLADNGAKITVTHTASGQSVQTNSLIVNAAAVASISIKTQPDLVYTEGDSLDLGTLAVTLHMDNGTAEDIAFADFAANGITTDTADGKVLALTDDGSKITVTHTASGQSVQTNSLTVNAPQVITYTVTFVDWNGHTIDTQTINEGSNATAPSDPTRAGYIFIGWDKAFNNITSNLTVTAVYIEDIPAVTDAEKVAQDIAALNIGFAAEDSENSVTQDITLEEVGSVYSSDITWTSDNEAIEISGDTGVVTRPVFSAGDEDVTVTARVYNNGASDIKDFHLKVLELDPVMYTVTFNKNGGSTEASPNSKTAVAGESIDTLPAAPTRSGYTFEGWNTAANGSGTVFTASTVITGNITVYAQWKEAPKDNDDKDDNSSGNSGSNGSNNTPPTPPDTGSSPGTTTTTATTDSSGNSTAAVTQPQLNKAIRQAVEEAARQGNGAAVKVEINVTAPAGAKSVETSIPKAAVSAVGDGKVDALTITTPIAAITFDGNALSTISKEAAGDVKITVSKVDAATLSEETKQTVGDRPVFDFSVTSGDKAISQFGGNVEVAVPYTPKAGEDISAIVIYYINAEGKLEIVSNCVYDPATGTISFSTNHFSQYAVGYNKVSFKDVAATAPYSKAVSFIAARKITLGTGNGSFNPKASITRGQFLVMVMNAYGIEPDKDSKNNFTDAGNTYYTEYLAAAKRLGLSNGIGNNMYAPEKDMTQQEMVTLLYNTLKTIGELPVSAGGKELSSYSDSNQIAVWAKDAMTLFVKAGIITGSENRLAPAENANRAQMAQLLYNLMTK